MILYIFSCQKLQEENTALKNKLQNTVDKINYDDTCEK